MDRDDDDLIVRHAANDLDDVLGILRGKARGRFVEKVNIRQANHIQADVKTFAFAAAQRFFRRAAHHGVATLAQAKLHQFSFQAAHAIAS